MKVSEILSRSVVSVAPDESVSHAARMMSRYNIGAVPVCTESGTLRGIITDRDIILRCVAAQSDPEDTPVRDVMTRHIVSASPDDDVREAARLMSEAQVRRLPVTDGDRLVGIVSLGDIAKNHVCDMETANALSEISGNIHYNIFTD